MENNVYYLIKKKKFQLLRNDLDILPPNYVRVQFLYCGICGGDYSCVSVGRFSPFRVGLKTPISVNLKSPMHHVCY